MFARPVEPRGTSGGPLTPWLVDLRHLVGHRRVLAGLGRRPPRRRSSPASPAAGPDFGPDFAGGAAAPATGRGCGPASTRARRGRLRRCSSPRRSARSGSAGRGGRSAARTGDDPLPSLADRRAVASLTLPQVAAKARRLRPSLAATPASLIRARRGRHRARRAPHPAACSGCAAATGTILYASLEDVVVAVMAPRAGKTTALTAPGHARRARRRSSPPRNKPDVWTTTIAARQQARHGAGCSTRRPSPTRQQDLVVEPAHPDHHLGGRVPARRPLRHPDPRTTAAAAKTSGTWPPRTCSPASSSPPPAPAAPWPTCRRGCPTSPAANRPASSPQHGFHAAARSVAGRQAGAPETRDGVYETARTAASCLSDPQHHGLGHPTGHAAARAGRHPRSPTPPTPCTCCPRTAPAPPRRWSPALTDQVLRAAVTRRRDARRPARPAAARASSTRPPTSARSATCRSCTPTSARRGILPITILQSYPQGAPCGASRAWPPCGRAATIKAHRRRHRRRQTRRGPLPARRRTRRPGRVAAPATGPASPPGRPPPAANASSNPPRSAPSNKGTALLLATGIPVAMIRLLPWYDRPARRRSSTPRSPRPPTRSPPAPDRLPDRQRHDHTRPRPAPSPIDPARLVAAHRDARAFYRHHLLDRRRRHAATWPDRGLAALARATCPGTPASTSPGSVGYAPPGWTAPRRPPHPARLHHRRARRRRPGPHRRHRPASSTPSATGSCSPSTTPTATRSRSPAAPHPAPDRRAQVPQHPRHRRSTTKDRPCTGSPNRPTALARRRGTRHRRRPPRRPRRLARPPRPTPACPASRSPPAAPASPTTTSPPSPPCPAPHRHGITTALRRRPRRPRRHRTRLAPPAPPTGIDLHAATLPDGTDPADLITSPADARRCAPRSPTTPGRCVQAVIDIRLDRLLDRHPDLLALHRRPHQRRPRPRQPAHRPADRDQILTLARYIAHRTGAGIDTVANAVIDHLEHQPRPDRSRPAARATSPPGPATSDSGPAPESRRPRRGRPFPPSSASANGAATPAGSHPVPGVTTRPGRRR